MSRKRTTHDSSTTDRQPPSTESAMASTEQSSITATLDAPTSETPVPKPEPGFVARLTQQRNPGKVPAPFNIASDYEAGVRLFENRRARQMAIQFEQKPSPDVLSHLKEAGFRWNNKDQVWSRTVFPEEALQIRIAAERTYQEVRQMIRQERGLGESPEIPF